MEGGVEVTVEEFMQYVEKFVENWQNQARVNQKGLFPEEMDVQEWINQLHMIAAMENKTDMPE